MSRSTSQQYSQIYAALHMLKMGPEAKEDMVFSYTNDKAKVSLRDLDFGQCQDLIRKLKNMVSPSPPERGRGEDCQAIRRRIIATCHQLGWYRYDGSGTMILKDGKKQVDYTRLDGFCMGHTAAKKAFNSMNKAELQATAIQFGEMLKASLK